MPRFVTFTPNPALDLSTAVDRLVGSHKLRCAAPEVHPGGGGINVARVLHRLGSEVLALYPAGGATGERLHALLAAEGVPDRPLPIAGETRESLTVLARDSGQEYRFVLPGPRLSDAEWQAALTHLQTLPSAPAWLISSGSLPPGVADDGHAQVARLAQHIGARMVVDSSGAALSAALAQGVWLVKPSLRELSDLAGTPLSTRAEQKQAARDLIGRGQAQVVALSLGAEGALLVTADQCLQADALPVPVAGSVGAGDSFLAGLIWALDRQAHPAQALATAMAAGAAAVMRTGTLLCQSVDVERMQQEVHVRSA